MSRFRTIAIARGGDKAALAKKLGAHVYVDSEAGNPGEALAKLGGARVILATVTSGKAMAAVLGETLELYHWAPAHTSGDLVIYLPKYKIVATGDIIATNNPYPRIHDEKNGSTEGWITTTKGIIALDADTYIPGHGNIQTKADIQKRIADAEARRAQVKEMVAQGKSLDEIKAALGDNDKLNYKSWTQICYDEMTKK